MPIIALESSGVALALGEEAGVGIAWALVFGWGGRVGRIKQPHFIILKAYIQNFSLLLKKKYNGAADQRRREARACSRRSVQLFGGAA
jgi:hypothetical protein